MSTIWVGTNRGGGLSGPQNALDHWRRHQNEFPEHNNALDYVRGAHNLINNHLLLQLGASGHRAI